MVHDRNDQILGGKTSSTSAAGLRPFGLLSLVITAFLTTAPPTPAQITQPIRSSQNTFALVVGISEYENLGETPGARDSAETVYELFSKSGFYTKKLLDRAATSAAIIPTLAGLISGATSADRVVVFFAGRGEYQSTFNPLSSALLPYDAERGLHPEQAVAVEEIFQIIEKSEIGQVLFLIDSKFGERSHSQTQRYTTLSTDRVEYLRAGASPSTEVLASGEITTTQLRDEGPSIFTWLLIQGIEGKADSNKDNMVASTELRDFIFDWRSRRGEELSTVLGTRQSDEDPEGSLADDDHARRPDFIESPVGYYRGRYHSEFLFFPADIEKDESEAPGFRLISITPDGMSGTVTGLSAEEYGRHRVVAYVQSASGKLFIHPHVGSSSSIRDDGSWALENSQRLPRPKNVYLFLVSDDSEVPPKARRKNVDFSLACGVIPYFHFQ